MIDVIMSENNSLELFSFFLIPSLNEEYEIYKYKKNVCVLL